MAFSRRHYRFVSPRELTPSEVAANKRLDAILAQAHAETLARFPAPAIEDAGKMIDWQRDRIYELRREAGV